MSSFRQYVRRSVAVALLIPVVVTVARATNTASGSPASVLFGADSVSAATAAALDAANAAFSAAWIRGDGAALGNAYTMDGILHPPPGGVLVGKTIVDAFWKPGSSGRLGHRLEPMVRRQLGSRHVLEIGRWHSRRATDSLPNPDWSWGCYSVIWEQGSDTKWRMLYDSWSEPRDQDWACRPRS